MTTDLTKSHFIKDEDVYLTPRGRSNFVALKSKFLNKKRTVKTINGKADEGAFALSLCFPPSMDLKVLKAAANEIAKSEGKGADLFAPGKSKGLKSPFINPLGMANPPILPGPDGEPLDLTGWTVIRANSYSRRPIVRLANGTVVDEDELDVEAYSGRWMRMMVRPAFYDQEGSKGVKFRLESVQLLKNDKPVGQGAANSGEAFGSVQDDDDEDDNETGL